MKKFDPDLTILDHADEATLMMLSETPLAGESERKKILEKSIRKYEQRVGALPGGESSDSVEGVENYRRPKWHITMSSLAAVVSLGIGFAAISHIMRSPSPAPPRWAASRPGRERPAGVSRGRRRTRPGGLPRTDPPAEPGGAGRL